jgi:c-di-GMP-binding flagellar brake protein YcgR
MNDTTSNNQTVTRMPLKDLGLRPGMALQTRRLVEGAVKKEAQFFGAIESKGVMVGPQGPDGEKTELEEGQVCVVRGFTGQYEFSFVSKVLQTFEKPFVYALLVYPAEVDARMVRQSMRTKTSWPTTVRTIDKDGTPATRALDATLVDISMQGAMVRAPSALAAIGDTIQINIAAMVEDVATNLPLMATICHNNKSRDGDFYFIGMAFKNLTQPDKLVLHYLTTTPHN